ncbi:TniQ family protein [Novosphingobium sp. G106]|nr:TniQ family protein [Novosphingobium sp. G106]
MNEYLDPLPDELLTSWFARRRHNLRGRGLPEPKAVRDSKGAWRHPDIRPTRTWLNSACDRFNVEPSQLAASTFVRRFPHLPVDFLAWDWAPFPTEREGLRPAPRLAIAWCSRCLAEDFAVGRPAHIRQQWVNASLGFCHLHRWPLSDRCAACGSIRWKFAAPTRGPLRMLCAECWRPLERSLPEVLHASKELRDCWDCVIAFEAEVQTALRGRTPDQFRFNFTSASQLLNEVRDICGLLARNRLGFTPSSIPPECLCLHRYETRSVASRIPGQRFAVPLGSRQRAETPMHAGCRMCHPRREGRSGSSAIRPQ